MALNSKGNPKGYTTPMETTSKIDYTQTESYLSDNFIPNVGNSIVNFYKIEQSTDNDLRELIKKLRKAKNRPKNKAERRKQEEKTISFYVFKKRGLPVAPTALEVARGALAPFPRDGVGNPGRHKCKNKNNACNLVTCPYCSALWMNSFRLPTGKFGELFTILEDKIFFPAYREICEKMASDPAYDFLELTRFAEEAYQESLAFDPWNNVVFTRLALLPILSEKFTGQGVDFFLNSITELFVKAGDTINLHFIINQPLLIVRQIISGSGFGNSTNTTQRKVPAPFHRKRFVNHHNLTSQPEQQEAEEATQQEAEKEKQKKSKKTKPPLELGQMMPNFEDSFWVNVQNFHLDEIFLHQDKKTEKYFFKSNLYSNNREKQPWFVSNSNMHPNLTIKEIKKYKQQFKGPPFHLNALISYLLGVIASPSTRACDAFISRLANSYTSQQLEIIEIENFLARAEEKIFQDFDKWKKNPKKYNDPKLITQFQKIEIGFKITFQKAKQNSKLKNVSKKQKKQLLTWLSNHAKRVMVVEALLLTLLDFYQKLLVENAKSYQSLHYTIRGTNPITREKIPQLYSLADSLETKNLIFSSPKQQKFQNFISSCKAGRKKCLNEFDTYILPKLRENQLTRNQEIMPWDK